MSKEMTTIARSWQCDKPIKSKFIENQWANLWIEWQFKCLCSIVVSTIVEKRVSCEEFSICCFMFRLSNFIDK